LTDVSEAMIRRPDDGRTPISFHDPSRRSIPQDSHLHTCHITANVLNNRTRTVVSLNLNSVNQLIFVMVKCDVLFEVRTEFLNNI
jgi:hypothetical protein